MNQKYSFLILLLCALLLLCGCAKGNGDVVDIGSEEATPVPEAQLPAVTPQPHMQPQATQAPQQTPAQAEEEAPGYGTNAAVKVCDEVAYVFSLENGKTLYGAVEYENVGDCPVTLSEANFTFTHGGTATEHTFAPPLAAYEVLLPGECGYLTLFLENAEMEEGTEVTLAASLTAEAAADERILMQADHLYLADNYPTFTTLTGTLTLIEEGDCEMNMVYVGFYDAEENLIGVWNFTKSAQFEGAGDTKNFTVHMRALPIDDLAANTASTKAVAFGFR